MNETRDPKDLLDWLGLKNAPTWRVARPLGYLFGFAVVGLFLLAVAAAAWTVLSVFTTPTGASFGTGALLVALLGAPFLVWRTIIAQKTVDFQKEGHITDRIAKAVEQLGAEKTVDRIGRPVTLWSGLPVEGERFFPDPDPVDLPPRSEEIDRRDDMRTVSVNLVATMKNGTTVRYRRWPEVRTLIEWQGKPLDIAAHDKVAAVGDWKTFAESLPNIEVRIGGILSLERIAKDSTAYDNGRDHVPIMEILCAYIRENAPASGAQDHPYGEWEPLKDDATEEEREAHNQARRERFGNVFAADGKVSQWARTLAAPRQDIALALQIIGRRNASQRRIEARWGKDATPNAEWPFDKPAPTLPEQDDPHGAAAIAAFKCDLDAWIQHLKDFPGYRPDLRNTNLQGADLSGLVLSGARLDDARMEGADLSRARMEGAELSGAWMEGAIALDAGMEGANLRRARMEGASLDGVGLNGAVLFRARIEGAALVEAHMQWSLLSEARMEGAVPFRALMEGAVLVEARIQKAVFRDARMEGTNLVWARMEAADLRGARMQVADMRGARIDQTTSLTGALLQGAALWNADISTVPISQDQVNATFGDGSVTLPDTFTRPPQWPSHELDWNEFETEWRKWQADPVAYTPPPPPD